MKKNLVLAILALLFLLSKPTPVNAAVIGLNRDVLMLAEPCPSPYIVKFGDSLRMIAKRCNIKTGDLITANPQIGNPDIILVGQEVIIPDESNVSPTPKAPAEPTPVPQEPKSGQAVAEQPEKSEVDIKPAVPVTGQETYQVQYGDSLGRIAKRLGLSIAQIMYANPSLGNPNLIYPGQTLKIPPADLVVDADAWKKLRIDQSVQIQQQSGTNYQPSNSERWIHIDLSTQTVHAYEGDQLIRSFLVSTGRPQTPTVTGQYKIWIKLRFDDMRGPGYYLRDVPYVMYFYKGYGLHGTYWHSNFGTPMSHGCVNLNNDDAAWLYEFASVGTVVNVQ